MSTLRANTLKPITSGNSLVLQGDSGGSGVSGPSIDSNGDVDFTQNTDAKVKLPSGGGIYESDGSTEILTESSGTVSLKNTSINANNIFPAGHIIQIVNKNFTDNYAHSGTSGAWVAVSGFTQTFTPTNSSNKVLVMLSTTIANSNMSEHTAVRVTRDGNSLSSPIFSNQLAGLGAHQTTYSNTTNSTRNGTGWYYDSPGTSSQVTYAVWGFSNAETFYMNRPTTFLDNNTYVGGMSNLTLMEIQA